MSEVTVTEHRNATHEALKGRFRSKLTVPAVREELDRRTNTVRVIRADLPVGKGWNDGTGFIFWKNLGWMSAEEYDAKQHSKEVEAKREAAADTKGKKESK